jgi:hypothetical protein
VVVDDVEHLLGLEVAEARPAAILVGASAALADVVFAFGEDAALEFFEFETGGFIFLERVEIVEAPQEEQLGDLLDDFEGIGNAAGPEGVPEGVDFTADVAGEHGWDGGERAAREGASLGTGGGGERELRVESGSEGSGG